MIGYVIANVDVVVSGPEQTLSFRNRDIPDEPLVRILRQELLHVVDVGVRTAGGGEQQRPAIGMFVHEDVVKPTRCVAGPDQPELLDLAGVGESGDVQYDGTYISIRPTLPELQ